MHVHQMIRTHPHVQGSTNDPLIKSIEEALACAQACTSCADACLGEDSVANLTQCIRLNLDCADVCAATAAIATRRTGSNEDLIRNMLEVCAGACSKCAEECEKHAGKHEHCRVCAEACRSCEQACRDAAATIH
jgi:class 3 adenylate cyclase